MNAEWAAEQVRRQRDMPSMLILPAMGDNLEDAERGVGVGAAWAAVQAEVLLTRGHDPMMEPFAEASRRLLACNGLKVSETLELPATAMLMKTLAQQG